MDAEIKNGLEEKVDKLLAVAKLSQYSIEKGKRDSGHTPKQTPTNSRQNTPTKRDGDMRSNLQGLEANASGPFPEGLRPIQCFKCNVVLLHCGCLSLNPFIEFRIRNNSSSSDVLYIQASISISPKYESTVIYCCMTAQMLQYSIY